jgi:hypothetical protein
MASKIAQPSSPVSSLVTGLVRSGSSRAAACRVVPSCSCYRCVDLYGDRDSSTKDYAHELPLFRRSVAADATVPDVRFSPVHRIGAGSGTALLILAAVPPSAGEYRFVRVATVLILLGHTLVLILCWFSRV